jgi:hypothetical protein
MVPPAATEIKLCKLFFSSGFSEKFETKPKAWIQSYDPELQRPGPML